MELRTPNEKGLHSHSRSRQGMGFGPAAAGKELLMSVATVSPTSLVIQSMDQISINTIRTLSMDAVQAANSGHPGTPPRPA